ncbi:MAG: amino acid transporter [Acidimicrobiia bacterium]|nr:amino acid transporter [Acidimicrobiia bacterium]
MDELEHGFESVGPDRAPAIMAGYPADWWVSGGWALDLVHGSKTRDHIDLDIGVYREDVPHLFDSFDLEFHAAADGKLRHMGEAGDLWSQANSIWVRRPGAQKWLLEMILNESDGDEWVYRRDARVRLPRKEVAIDVDGIPCVRPEIQLLFKAKQMRDRDIADFQLHGHRLHPTARSWLKDALRLAHPGHPWITDL